MEAKQSFGRPQRECEICKEKLTEFRVLRIKVKAASGESLADLQYEVPLCKAHRGDDSKAVNVSVSWEKEMAYLSVISATNGYVPPK